MGDWHPAEPVIATTDRFRAAASIIVLVRVIHFPSSFHATVHFDMSPVCSKQPGPEKPAVQLSSEAPSKGRNPGAASISSRSPGTL